MIERILAKQSAGSPSRAHFSRTRTSHFYKMIPLLRELRQQLVLTQDDADRNTHLLRHIRQLGKIILSRLSRLLVLPRVRGRGQGGQHGRGLAPSCPSAFCSEEAGGCSDAFLRDGSRAASGRPTGEDEEAAAPGEAWRGQQGKGDAARGRQPPCPLLLLLNPRGGGGCCCRLEKDQG